MKNNQIFITQLTALKIDNRIHRISVYHISSHHQCVVYTLNTNKNKVHDNIFVKWVA